MLSVIALLGAICVASGHRHFGILILGRLLFGFGSECMSVTAQKMLSHRYKDSFLSLAFGFQILWGQLGSCLVFILMPVFATSLGTIAALWTVPVYAVFSLITTLLYCFIDYKYERESRTRISPPISRRSSLTPPPDSNPSSFGNSPSIALSTIFIQKPAGLSSPSTPIPDLSSPPSSSDDLDDSNTPISRRRINNDKRLTSTSSTKRQTQLQGHQNLESLQLSSSAGSADTDDGSMIYLDDEESGMVSSTQQSSSMADANETESPVITSHLLHHHNRHRREELDNVIADETEESVMAVASTRTEKFRLKDLKSLPLVFWVLLVLYFSVSTSFFVWNSFGGDRLQEKFGYEPKTAGMVVALSNLAAMASPVSGFIVDRIGHRTKFIGGGVILMLITYTAVTFTSIIPTLWYVLLGLGVSLCQPIVFASVSLVVKDSIIGTAFAIMSLAMNIGQVSFPPIVGLMHQNSGSYESSNYLFIALALLALSFSILLFFLDSSLRILDSIGLSRGTAPPSVYTSLYHTQEFSSPSPSSRISLPIDSIASPSLSTTHPSNIMEDEPSNPV